MPGFTRTREFFKDGGALLSAPGGRLARALAGLGVAAAVAVVPYPLAERTHDGPAAAVEVNAPASEQQPDGTFGASAYAIYVAAAAVAEKGSDLLTLQASRLAGMFHVHKFGRYEVPQFVAEAIVRAARDTGFPPDTLMAIAEKESSFNVGARPPRGSALGPFQFIEQTWLSVVRDYGAEFGLGDEAAAIKSRVVKAKGGNRIELYMDDASQQDRLLALRTDPYLSAALAAKDLIVAKERIESRLEAAMSNDDLYLPHFLGKGGAELLLAKSEEKPGAAARKVFPKAAQFNAGMFRGKGGRQLTVRQFHERARAVITERVGKYRDVEARVMSVSASHAPEAENGTGLRLDTGMLRR